MKYVFNPFTANLDSIVDSSSGLDTTYIKKINDPITTDMGVEQGSSADGVGEDYISDKRLSHVLLGSSDRDVTGSIRLNSGTFQIYANGVWNDVVINFVFREDSAGSYELEHKPVGFTFWYEVMSGNSDKIGLDSKPVIQQYSSSMGAYQHDLQLDGGDF